MDKRRPQELKRGDRFRPRGGPYGGRLMEVLESPTRGRYGTVDVRCRPLEAVRVGLEPDVEVELANG